MVFQPGHWKRQKSTKPSGSQKNIAFGKNASDKGRVLTEKTSDRQGEITYRLK